MNTSKEASAGPSASADRMHYSKTLRRLQIELVKLQSHVISCDEKILVVLEGRDAAGKDGVVKRIVEHLSPRETRVVALGKPSDRDRSAWYFQRWAAHLPAQREFVLFNRSWYNRAGVEHVMGFCTKDEYREFIATVPAFEEMLVRSGVKLLKYYLDISRAEQKHRLSQRRTDPLKQWKLSPIDKAAPKLWSEYSTARDAMLAATHNEVAPWTIIRTDDKRAARVNLIKDLLFRVHYRPKDKKLIMADPSIVFPFADDLLKTERLAQ
ncbi:polyphosphate kinase 2 [Cupriavidus sp. 8B]